MPHLSLKAPVTEMKSFDYRLCCFQEQTAVFDYAAPQLSGPIYGFWTGGKDQNGDDQFTWIGRNSPILVNPD